MPNDPQEPVRCKVLLIEDERRGALELKRQLESHGLAVCAVAPTGGEAVGLAQKFQPNVIVMDTILSGGEDGIAVANDLRREVELPVIFVTSRLDSVTLAQAKLALPFGYLFKPFEIGQLSATIEMAVARHQADLRETADRRQNRKHLQPQASLLDQTRDAVIVHEIDGPITYWNPGAERIYGWSADEALGRLASELLGNGATDKHSEISASLHDVQEWSGELDHLTKAHRKIVVDSRQTLVADPLNGRPSVLTISTDITGKKRQEGEQGRARSLENLGAIANSVAHELNNSLGPILMAVDLLRLQPLADPVQELVEMIDTSAREGAATVNQLLAFSKGAKGEHLLLNFGHLVREVAKVVRSTYPKSIRINVALQPDLWMITGDAAQLPQMLLCLCANARDAMPQGGSLNISARNSEFGVDFTGLPPEAPPGAYLYLEVVDTGNGIPEAEQPKLFDPSAAGDQPIPGFRLGLSTAHEITKNHGGFIRCCSKIGAGTSFQIYLPAQPRMILEPVPDGHSGKIDVRGLTVLVADDEPLGRRLLKSMLQFRGFKVLEAADGTEAVALFAQHHAEIKGVFTDLIMPHMDGFQLAFAMKRMQPNVKIIVISGLPKSLWQLGSDALNVLSLLPKPFRPDELDAVLRANFSSYMA